MIEFENDRDPVVCEFCLHDPICCDCDHDAGGLAQHLMPLSEALARRRIDRADDRAA